MMRKLCTTQDTSGRFTIQKKILILEAPRTSTVTTTRLTTVITRVRLLKATSTNTITTRVSGITKCP